MVHMVPNDMIYFISLYGPDAENLPNVSIRNWEVHCEQEFSSDSKNQFYQAHVIVTKVVNEQSTLLKNQFKQPIIHSIIG